jgi:hypothetical protein
MQSKCSTTHYSNAKCKRQRHPRRFLIHLLQNLSTRGRLVVSLREWRQCVRRNGRRFHRDTSFRILHLFLWHSARRTFTFLVRSWHTLHIFFDHWVHDRNGPCSGKVVVLAACRYVSPARACIRGYQSPKRDTTTVIIPEKRSPVSPLQIAEYGKARFVILIDPTTRVNLEDPAVLR